MKKINYKKAAVLSALLLTFGLGTMTYAAQPVPAVAETQNVIERKTNAEGTVKYFV